MTPQDKLSEHFIRAEFACKNNCGYMSPDPLLVSGLEALRALINANNISGQAEHAIYIDDACRCEKHNAEVGGAPHSEHVQGLAADIIVPGFTSRELYVYAVKVPQFKGFGVSTKEYLHVDTRAIAARWCYDEGGKVVKWFDTTPDQTTLPT